MSLLRSLRALALPGGVGLHRARPSVPLAVIAQGWRQCGTCARPRASVLHADDTWTCGTCGTGGH